MAEYNFIIVSKKASEVTLAYKLYTTEKRILIFQRNDFQPKEKGNLGSKKHTSVTCYNNSTQLNIYNKVQNDIDNSHVITSSFFSTHNIANPSSRIIANSLKISNHLLKKN